MATLRPFSTKDWPHFYALDLETADAALDSEAPETEHARLRDRWPAVLALRGVSKEGFIAPGAALWVLEGPDQSYLGHLWLTEKHDGISGMRLLEVTTMGVVREARGQGFGRTLMQKAEEEAKARGISLVELSLAGNNRRARDLYRDLGFDSIRRTMRKRLHTP